MTNAARLQRVRNTINGIEEIPLAEYSKISSQHTGIKPTPQKIMKWLEDMAERNRTRPDNKIMTEFGIYCLEAANLIEKYLEMRKP